MGEAASLACALLWAVSVTLFRGPVVTHGARSVNLVKCLVAAALQLATVLALGQLGALSSAPPRELLYLVVSGGIGLVLGDTALFAAVPRIGVHRTMLLQTLAPVFTAVTAATWQAERISARQALGAVLILAGVALVVAPSRADRHRWPLVGVALAVLAALGQGVGVVLAKAGMQTVPILPASLLRLGTAALILAALAGATGRLGRLRDVVRSPAMLSRVLPATLMGTYLALFLMMAGVALAPASIAAVLLSMSPVFTLLLEAVRERRLPSRRGVAGTLASLLGVAVLTY